MPGYGKKNSLTLKFSSENTLELDTQAQQEKKFHKKLNKNLSQLKI